MDTHCGMSLHGYPCLDINVDIHPRLYGQLKTDIQKSWISMLISVDFWKSMHGFAMDSRTRVSIPPLLVWTQSALIYAEICQPRHVALP